MSQQAAQWPNTDPGNKPAATFPPAQHPNPDAVEHGLLHTKDQQEGGKEMGLVKAPIVSMHATSKLPDDTKEKVKPKLIEDANFKLNHYLPEQGHVEFDYPFEDLEVGQGFFIAVETTTDALMAKLHKQVDKYRKQSSEIERDENGDDVMLDVAINQKKRNEDGTVQLDNGVPRLGIKSGFQPKLIGPNFVVKAVVKGDSLAENNEADSDGALVIRMS